MTDFDHEIDCRGLLCPLPILRTKKGLRGLSAGQILRMTSTDPGSVLDMEAFCRSTGHELVDRRSEGREHVFFVRKRERES